MNALEQIQKQIESLENQVLKLETENDGLQEKNKRLTNRNKALREKVTRLENNVPNKSEISALQVENGKLRIEIQKAKKGSESKLKQIEKILKG